ncbi:MAG: molybdopterin molybdenumtransferase MoeA [Thermoleophilia bacterium]|nr:molybdopterin molybdenumtransferase MoeA [Thermoleophilia bacterium]
MTTDLPHKRIPIDEARARVIAAVRLLDTEAVALAELAGRTVGVAVVAPHSLPTHANSAMDGYAVRAGSVGPWPISAQILAGDNPAPLVSGSAAAIATGGVLPDGADAVVPIERVDVVADLVTATEPIASGDFVRHVGADVQAGDIVLQPGTRLTPLATSAVAGLGLTSVACIRRPRVVVLTTGDELVPPGTLLQRGQIHESNSVLVGATLAAAGCEIVRIDNVADTAEATRAAFTAALTDADLVVSTGGVSVGPRDHVKPALLELGVSELFWRIATQPGQPVWCGSAPDGTLVAGLPGNPLSCLVGLHLLLIPAVRAMLGDTPEPVTVRAELVSPIAQLPGRLRAIPMLLEADRLEPLGAGASHQLSRAARANALALIPTGAGELPAGTIVDAVPLT